MLATANVSERCHSDKCASVMCNSILDTRSEIGKRISDANVASLLFDSDDCIMKQFHANVVYNSKRALVQV